MKISKQDQIDNILDWFNFDKVHRAMLALDWKWHSLPSPKVPEIAELRQAARKMLFSCSPNSWNSCGGLKVTNHENGALELSFILEEWGGEDSFNPETTTFLT